MHDSWCGDSCQTQGVPCGRAPSIPDGGNIAQCPSVPTPFPTPFGQTPAPPGQPTPVGQTPQPTPVGQTPQPTPPTPQPAPTPAQVINPMTGKAIAYVRALHAATGFASAPLTLRVNGQAVHSGIPYVLVIIHLLFVLYSHASSSSSSFIIVDTVK